MSDRPVLFGDVRGCVKAALDTIDLPTGGAAVYVIRDLFGKIGLSISEDAHSDALQEALDRLSSALAESLGAHGRPAERTVVWVDPELLRELRSTAREITPGVFWVDRLVVGDEWWTVGEERPQGEPVRYTLHSVKGGMGRSTTAAVVAWHLARRGEDVLAVDFDIESPGLASAIEEKAQPTFGVADWFVEELVEQGNIVVDQMVAQPAWTRDLEGNVWVAPAHGRDPGEYLAKLGRVYMDTAADPWVARMQRLLADLETNLKPSVVLVESHSGLHDIAAATVTDIGAHVLLFAVDSASAWTGYDILFNHWKTRGLAPKIRERLSIVSALTPELETERYLAGFREKAWDLFRDSLYDPLSGGAESPDAVSYGFSAEDAPHSPLVIRWNRGLAAGSSLRRLEESAAAQAYSPFLRRFKQLHGTCPTGLVRLDATSKIRVTGTAGLSVSPGDIETVRIALSGLPEGTSHGSPRPPSQLYLPPSHRKALDPNVMLVTGMRGAGKTFWWTELQDPSIRALLARLDPRLAPTAESDVNAGFGVRDAPNLYPGRDGLRTMMEAGVKPRTIWRTVHVHHLADADHALRTLSSWLERARYVEANPEEIDKQFSDCDDALVSQGQYSLTLFDGLDRSADGWPEMRRLIRGLLRHALDMRSYRRLRAKVFLRVDQADDATIFADASKVLSSAVELTWPRRDLYGMLWQYLGNGRHGERLRQWLAEGDWPALPINGRRIFKAPPSLTADEDIQRERFHAIAGPWMGTDRRRGFPYTWIPNHLGDANGMVSPRSFIAALRAAADDTADRHPEHDHALHYDSVKRGVQEASKIRVRELQEDYPWVDRLLGPLAGIVVPCAFEEIASIWKKEDILNQLSAEIDRDDVKLLPRHIGRRAIGVRKDLEALGVFRSVLDDRVDIPDVFRVGYGLGRKGGVKPVK